MKSKQYYRDQAICLTKLGEKITKERVIKEEQTKRKKISRANKLRLEKLDLHPKIMSDEEVATRNKLKTQAKRDKKERKEAERQLRKKR